MQVGREVPSPVKAERGDASERPPSQDEIRVRGFREEPPEVLGVPRSGPIIAGQDLHGDQVPESGDGHDETGKYLDAFGLAGDLGLDTGRREQDVDDDAASCDGRRGGAAGSWRGVRPRPAPRRPRPPSHRRRARRSSASAAASSETATATSTSRVVRGSARAETARPPTSAHRSSRRSSPAAIARRADSSGVIAAGATAPTALSHRQSLPRVVSRATRPSATPSCRRSGQVSRGGSAGRAGRRPSRTAPARAEDAQPECRARDRVGSRRDSTAPKTMPPAGHRPAGGTDGSSEEVYGAVMRRLRRSITSVTRRHDSQSPFVFVQGTPSP